MRILRMIWFRLRTLLQREQLNAELDDELRFHVHRETAENIARGMSADEARRTALAQFGGIERFKETLRDEHRVLWLGDTSADVRHAFRLLRTNKLFSASVILTLALGIGATSTIFAIVNGVLLQPLPYPDSNRIVSLSESQKGEDRERIGQRAYPVWKNAARAFTSVAMFKGTSATFTGNGEPVEIDGMQTTPSFFSVMGAPVAFGRTFSATENQGDSPQVVVLGHELWATRFGGDSTVLNRSIMMNGTSHTVIGVMRPAFGKPWRAKYFVPLVEPKSAADVEYYYDAVARLRAGVTPEKALLELNTLAMRVDSLRSKSNGGKMPVVMTLHARKFGSVERPLTILLCAVFVLLLIACANVANLTMARSASRQREFAVRLALGAGRGRLVRQVLVESFLLAGIGGAIGTLVPAASLRLFTSLSPSSLAGVTDIRVDTTVLAFTLVITVVVALLFGLAPALTGTLREIRGALHSGAARSGATKSQRTLRRALIVFEVAAALVLLTGAGLVTKSFSRAMNVKPGFTAQHRASAYIYLGRRRYPESASVIAFFSELEQRVRALPGVQEVSASATKPLGGFSMTAELPRSANDSTKAEIAFAEVDGHYGDAAGLHKIAGRFIDETDRRGTPLVAMISAGAARHFFPGRDAVGQVLPAMSTYGDSARLTVVGVVEDVPQRSLDIAPLAEVYVPGAQHGMRPGFLIVRSSLEPAVLQQAIRRFVTEIDPLQAVTEFSTLEDDLAKSVAPRRFNSMFINAFAMTALVLAIVGLYGLMAHNVASRTRELGIRITLGAQSDNVLRLVLRQGMSLVLAGIVIGSVLAMAFSKTVAALLYDVPPQDPVIFVGAPLLLVLAGFAACYLPARHATLVNPITALRED